MIRPVLIPPDPKLRQKSKPVKNVDKKVLKLIRDMKDTLDAQKDPEGVGLAAPQIGKNICIFIMKLTPQMALKLGEDVQTKVIINPQIVSVKKVLKSKKKKKEILEGCLSLPHFYGPLVRSSKVTIDYLKEDGKKTTQTFTDFPAQIVLHEIDHLNGILFVDRLIEQGEKLYEYQDDEWSEVELA